MNELLKDIAASLAYFIPELILILCFVALLVAGLFRTKFNFLLLLPIICFSVSCYCLILQGFNTNTSLFSGMLRHNGFSTYIKILLDVTGLLTCLISVDKKRVHHPEYFALLVAVVLGGHMLAMSTNFLMIFLSLELISISSYVLAGFSFTKSGSEGSLKYFLFGSVASAIMLYGFSILYGVTGTLDFSGQEFFNGILNNNSPLLLLASLMVLAGFLYKIAAAPMHLWAPDIYESAPMAVVAFFSVAPKLAGFAVLTKFVLAVNLFGQSIYDWQLIICVIAILTITIGNFSALRQQVPKRLMAYSSIAQSGFMLIGVSAFLPQGISFMLFYATVYLLMNFLVFIYLDFYEKRGITTIAAFQGTGRLFAWPSVLLLIGMIALTGLPPTGGFTAKLFIFSSLWQSYELTGKFYLLALLIFGLLNTVVSLFYYLRIPYFAFLKVPDPNKPLQASDLISGKSENIITFQNLLGLILVLLLLIVFFVPGMLMGWINKINFVL